MPGDVADQADVRRCIAGLQRPLKGVFHLAGTLDDCLLADLTPESLARVFAPKARGALNLHHATAGCALDHFVLFSSIASTLGNPGQVNYSAANAFVDGLAALRRRQGLPALGYNLAAVAEAGMAARNLHVLRMSRAGGVPPVSADFAITNLDYAMRTMAAATTWSPPCSRARRGRWTRPTTCAPGGCSATRTRSRSTPAASSPRTR